MQDVWAAHPDHATMQEQRISPSASHSQPGSKSPNHSAYLRSDSRSVSPAIVSIEDENGEILEQIEEIDEGSDPTSEPVERTEEELEKLEDEIRDMEVTVEGLESYRIVDRLGEGTFSSVYKAVDLRHHLYDNYLWTGKVPLSFDSPDLDLQNQKNVYVALKRIYVTSSPQRILNELEIMEELRDCRFISFLITAFRTEDQVIAVMPYSRHSDFRDYYRIIPIADLRCYFRCLFSALKSTHAANIVHRDVKPANFLYDPRTGEGVLCDFGLAERFDPAEWRGKCHHTCPDHNFPHGRAEINHQVQSTHTMPGGVLHSSRAASTRKRSGMGPPERIGYLKDDQRPTVRANRAGTRGFRAPEVLLKCQDQTTALDIWSAGIILLAFLTKRFPLFNSNDDIEALLELSVIFGKKRIEQVALLHNRTFNCNIPHVEQPGMRIPEFIMKLNPGIADPGSHPDPERYSRDVQNAMDLARVCLHLDCTRRWTAEDVLHHPFLAEDEEEGEGV